MLGKTKEKIKAPNYDGSNKVISDNLKTDNGHLKKDWISGSVSEMIWTK